jgi:hypothetical protein
MPSPFLGMDPYLEDPGEWNGVHGRLIAILGEMLTRLVRPRFFVASKTSVYFLGADDLGQSLVHRQPFLEVYDRESRQPVTTIELLSPINKEPGSAGRDEHWAKRRLFLASRTHWLEIDLLRAGARPPEVNSIGDYYALLRRGDGDGDAFEVWPIGLRDRLPTVAVPLIAPMPDVPLDLQAALAMLFERYDYADWLDYGGPPPAPPLTAADARWADDCIRRWRDGHRP